MTHPTTPPPPSGPREPIEALDPETPEGQAATEAITQALAEIQVEVWKRRNSSKRHNTDAA
jgi:hypothetical protein